MKKMSLAIAIAMMIVSGPLAQAQAPGAAATSPVAAVAEAGRGGTTTLLLAGSSGPNEIRISLSADGREYQISSSGSLEGAGEVCLNPVGNADELLCKAPAIAGFVFNGGPGDDSVIVAKNVPAPATLRGGPGNDVLVGGAGNDSLSGGQGNDTLVGRGGEDLLVGGPGEDRLVGGSGEDTCNGGPGKDVGISCEIEKEIP